MGGVGQNLSKRLAVAVRSIHWSYAIFWSISSRQQGVLEWGDGYYNGDIKTRDTVQAVELKAEKIALQRSEQLRELYKSLLEGEIEQQVKRPSSGLSPEDLSDAEWYYVVCMSFAFNPGQGLPGRAFANKQTIWLCNAQYADSKVFCRSLLAKSASIQTVVCFRHLDGVIELGATELVMEDPSIVQHFKASLLDFSKPICSEKSSAPHNDNDKDHICANISNETVYKFALEKLYTPTEGIEFEQEGVNQLHRNFREELNVTSPDDCLYGSEQNHQTNDSMLDGLNDAASQVQSWYFMDDEFRNGIQDSINSSDCISEALVNEEKVMPSPRAKNVSRSQLEELQEGNHSKSSSLDIGADDDLHYKRTLSVILRSSNQLIENSCFPSGNYKSSFVSWKRGVVDGYKPLIPQKTLKKILIAVPLMHGGHSLKLNKESGREAGRKRLENDRGHIALAKQLENENFLVLRSLIPSINEIEDASTFNDVIVYLKELQATVEELESCVDSGDNEARLRRNCVDMVEQTSDNYQNKKIGDGKKFWINKRKAGDVDETGPELHSSVPDDGLPLDVKVSIKENKVVIELRCSYREYLLLDIMDELNNLHLDAHSVQSSTVDGILTLSLTSKFRGEAVTPARMIKQALLKIACE